MKIKEAKSSADINEYTVQSFQPHYTRRGCKIHCMPIIFKIQFLVLNCEHKGNDDPGRGKVTVANHDHWDQVVKETL